MFEWNVEELKLRNEQLKGGVYLGNEYIFACERELTKEEKIDFVDKMQNGKLSYILELVEKFNNEKDNLPKDNWGNVKTVSLKAWTKRNDNKYGDTDYSRVIDSWYKYGRIYFLGCERNICCDFLDRKANYDTYSNYVDEIFHRQLKQCLNKENLYFKEHDEYEVLKKKVEDKMHEYGTTFGVHIAWGSDLKLYDNNDNSRRFTIDELKLLLSKYEELGKAIENISKEIEIKY